MTTAPANRPLTGREATQFKPGQSGNYSGRPKKDRGLIAALEAAVDKTELAEKLVELAMGGDMMAVRYIYDRIEGSPTQRHEVSYDAALDEVRRMAQERGLSPEDTQRAVEAAEEMLARGSA